MYRNGKVSGFTNPLLINSMYNKNRNLILDRYLHFGRKGVELCLTDWELSISRFAHEQMIPCVSIDNQHKFKFDKPDNLGIIDSAQFYLAKLFCNMVIPYATEYIVITFKEFSSPNCTWVPILPSEEINQIKNLGREPENFNLVYCKSDTFRYIEGILPKERTKIYSNERIESSNPLFTWVPINRQGFLKDLRCCKKLYANAGNTLISEALYLDIPLEIIPIKRHFEQSFNYQCVQNMGNEMFDGSKIVYHILKKYLR
jgi:uncharacterized protein (TIGR00661 family)